LTSTHERMRLGLKDTEMMEKWRDVTVKGSFARLTAQENELNEKAAELSEKVKKAGKKGDKKSQEELAQINKQLKGIEDKRGNIMRQDMKFSEDIAKQKEKTAADLKTTLALIAAHSREKVGAGHDAAKKEGTEKKETDSARKEREAAEKVSKANPGLDPKSQIYGNKVVAQVKGAATTDVRVVKRGMQNYVMQKYGAKSKELLKTKEGQVQIAKDIYSNYGGTPEQVEELITDLAKK